MKLINGYKRKVALSFEWDGCGEILDLPYNQFINKYMRLITQSDRDYLKRVLELIKKLFLSYLKELGEDASSELFVGSLRQSLNLDNEGTKQFDNKACFPVLKRIANENDWTFNPLLLADIYDEQDNERKPPLKLGTAMYDKQYDTCIDAHKIDIVSTQIQELAIKYPNEEIDYYFIDNDEEVLERLCQYFEDYPEHKPQNISLHLMKFDWFSIFENAVYRNLSDEVIKAQMNNVLQTVKSFPSAIKGYMIQAQECMSKLERVLSNIQMAYHNTSFFAKREKRHLSVEIKILSMIINQIKAHEGEYQMHLEAVSMGYDALLANGCIHVSTKEHKSILEVTMNGLNEAYRALDRITNQDEPDSLLYPQVTCV